MKFEKRLSKKVGSFINNSILLFKKGNNMKMYTVLIAKNMKSVLKLRSPLLLGKEINKEQPKSLNFFINLY